MTSQRRHVLTAATRKRISAAATGKKHPHKGHAVSAAARAKISAKLKGRSHKGHAMSTSARAKLSASLRGKKHPHRGHPLSASAKAKLSARGKTRAAKKAARHRPGIHAHRVAKQQKAKVLAGWRRRNPIRSHRPVKVTLRRVLHIRRPRRGMRRLRSRRPR